MVLSPITKTNNVTKILDIPVEEIVSLYKNNHATDVRTHFDGIKTIEVYECNDSKLRFYYPIISGDGAFYEDLYSRFSAYNAWKWEFSYAKNIIKPHSKVLEVGCGDGFFLEGIRSIEGVSVKGIDFNEAACRTLKEKGFECSNSLDNEEGELYDFVCCFQVLEHVDDPLAFLEKLFKLVKPAGDVIIAVPNNNPYLYGYDIMHTLNLPPHHVTLWGKESLEALPRFIEDVFYVESRCEPISLSEIQRYVDMYRIHFGSLSFKYFCLTRCIPKRFWVKLARFFPIDGRNIVAHYKKK